MYICVLPLNRRVATWENPYLIRSIPLTLNLRNYFAKWGTKTPDLPLNTKIFLNHGAPCFRRDEGLDDVGAQTSSIVCDISRLNDQ
jgi:hypothetical protein